MLYAQPFQAIDQLEQDVAAFFGARYGVAVDSCTHAIELSLRFTQPRRGFIEVPTNTYVSVPMIMMKVGWEWRWTDYQWEQKYNITEQVVDAAADWRQDSHNYGQFTCISFGFKKHINIGRGGMILCDDSDAANALRRMRYDGRRIHSGVPYVEDSIHELGFHYYMTPEQAREGLSIVADKKHIPAKRVSWRDYPDLTSHPVFRSQLLLNRQSSFQ